MEKLIDIIIPAYNAHNTISKTLMSIASQTVSDLIKVTIVNDASDKDYSEIIKNFTNFLDIEEITLEKNIGCGLARQTGIDNTNLKYIMFIDADDLLANPFTVFSLYTTMESYDYNVTYGEIQDVRLKTGNYIPIPADHFTWIFGSIYRREFIENNGIIFKDSSRGEDTGFNKLCKLLSEKEKICFLKNVTYLWTDGNENRINESLHFRELYSKIGYIENLHFVYDLIKDRNIEISEDFLKFDMLGNFAMLFYQNIEVNTLDNLSDKQKKDFLIEIKKFYDKHYIQYKDKITLEDISFTFRINDEDARRKYNLSHNIIITEIHFYEFLKMLDVLDINNLK